MIVPNKFIRYEDSVISNLITMFDNDGKNVEINHLFAEVANKFNCVDEFIYTLDVLYLLDEIDVDFEKGELVYVKRDKV